jgi:hypothetical protein
VFIMPPSHRLYIKKKFGGYEWGNTYAVNAADEDAAYAVGLLLGESERTYTWNGVSFNGIRVSTWAEDGRTGRTRPFAGLGLVAMANPLPPEACVRIQFFPGVKQASVKFYRFLLNGTDQAAGVIGADKYGVLTNMGTQLMAHVGFVDNAGVDLSGNQVDREVGNHQLYRAWAARAGVDAGD